jgi:hypothetical protein
MEAIRFRCSSCEQTLQIGADKAGRKVRCKRCQALCVVPMPEDRDQPADAVVPATEVPREKSRHEPRTKRPPPDTTTEIEEDSPHEEDRDDSEEARPRRRKKQRPPEAWRLPRLGLMILLAGAIGGLIASLGGSMLGMAMLRGSTLDSILRSLTVMLWVAMGLHAAGFLVQVVGFSLCLFAPKESESRPAAVTALACTLLTGFLLPFVLWLEARPLLASSLDTLEGLPSELERMEEESKAQRKRAADQRKAQAERLEQARKLGKEEFDKEQKAQAKRAEEELTAELKRLEKRAEKQIGVANRQMGQVRRSMLVLMLWGIVQTLVQGVYYVSVPLLLRAFCRAINRKELEPTCENLLKFGAGLIGVGLLHRFFGLLPIPFLGTLIGPASALLSLAWQVLYVILLIQLWRAMPARR